MTYLPGFTSIGARLVLAAAIPAVLLSATPIVAQQASTFAERQDGVGSAHPAFRRHFWRGQANHGLSSPNGYAVYDPATGLYFDAEG